MCRASPAPQPLRRLIKGFSIWRSQRGQHAHLGLSIAIKNSKHFQHVTRERLLQSLRPKTAPTATFRRRCSPWHEEPPGARNHGGARGWAPRWVPPLCGVVRGRVCRVCDGPGLAKELGTIYTVPRRSANRSPARGTAGARPELPESNVTRSFVGSVSQAGNRFVTPPPS
jgi:hypothetical protein